MVYATVDSTNCKAKGQSYLEEMLRKVEAGNSDIFVNRHAALMMQRREVNDDTLAEVIYGHEEAKESKKEPGVIEYISFEGSRTVEAICVVEQYKQTGKYRIKVKTVHVYKK